MMKSALVSLVALLPLAGCSETSNLRFSGAAVAPAGDAAYGVVQGTSQVLMMYRYSENLIPFPDAYGGYTLDLQLEPALVREGAQLQVPSAGVQPYLSLITGPSHRRSTNVNGSILIERVRGRELRARVRLESTDLPWEYAGEVTFASAVVRVPQKP